MWEWIWILTDSEDLGGAPELHPLAVIVLLVLIVGIGLLFYFIFRGL